MMNSLRALLVFAVFVMSVAPAAAQTSSPTDADWKVNVYPLLAWVPVFGADFNVPNLPSTGNPGGPNNEGVIDTKLAGALMFGLDVERGPWRVDADGMWIALTGDRPALPKLKADVGFIYAHASGGRKIYKDLYITAGVRRLALSFDITVEALPTFSIKPGLWDPLIGIGWHHAGKKTEFHATLEGSGFGVGADSDIAGTVRFDWKPIPHVGLTVGYGGIYVKLTQTVLTRTFTESQSLQGPIAGLGIYF